MMEKRIYHPPFCPGTNWKEIQPDDACWFDVDTEIGTLSSIHAHEAIFIARHQVVAWMRRELRFTAACNRASNRSGHERMTRSMCNHGMKCLQMQGDWLHWESHDS